MLDLGATIEHGLRLFSADAATNLILLALFATFGLALYFALKGRSPGFVHYAPNLLTSIGIFGTFAGIVIGLLDFDVSDIDGSIGPLLEGLKTAFITSLTGMALAMVFKGIDSTGRLAPKQDEEAPEEVGPQEIHSELKAQRQALERLGKAVAGDEDATLVSQIRLLRSDAQEQSKAAREQFAGHAEGQEKRLQAFEEELWRKLDQFAAMLSKSATETVINALKEVITDFNRNLTEQFGENFKELNVAVERLVEWQENYRIQLEQMVEQYAQGVRAIAATEQSVTRIGEESKAIPAAMDGLKTLLETAQHQLGELERHLEAFRDMRDRAVEAVPQLQRQMDTMVKDVSAAVQDAGEQIMTAGQSVSEALLQGSEEFKNNVDLTNEGLATATEQLTESIDTMQKRLESVLEEVFQAQTHQMNKAFTALEEEFRKAVGDTGEAVNKQLEAIDSAMKQEVERVMNAMGGALTSISKQFTNDYAKLVSAMDEVVRHGRSNQRAAS